MLIPEALRVLRPTPVHKYYTVEVCDVFTVYGITMTMSQCPIVSFTSSTKLSMHRGWFSGACKPGQAGTLLKHPSRSSHNVFSPILPVNSSHIYII